MEEIIAAPENWTNFIKKIIPKLQHQLLLLKGDLGAGKTTFTQYFLQELGCKEEVSSPTYSIVNEYHIKNGNVFHFDLYRLNSAQEVDEIGIEEYLYSDNMCIVEWPEIYEDHLKEIPHHTIEISKIENGRIAKFA